MAGADPGFLKRRANTCILLYPEIWPYSYATEIGCIPKLEE